MAEGPGSRRGDPGRRAHRAARTVGADHVLRPDRGERARRRGDGGEDRVVGGLQAGEFRAVPDLGSGRRGAPGEDGFEVVLRTGPDVIIEGHGMYLRAGEAGPDRHRVLAAEAQPPHLRLGASRTAVGKAEAQLAELLGAQQYRQLRRSLAAIAGPEKNGPKKNEPEGS